MDVDDDITCNVGKKRNMNIKSRIFGFSAAALIALSMTTGVMAQATSGTATVTLEESTCSAYFDGGKERADFGKWEYKNNRYVAKSGDKAGISTFHIAGQIELVQPGNGACDVNFALTNNALTGENSSNKIEGSNLTLSLGNQSSQTLASPASFEFTSSNFSGSLNLSVPQNAVPDVYTSSLAITTVNAD